jgi:hypothetical protein
MPTDGVFGKVKCRCETKDGKFFCPRCICLQDDNSKCDSLVARCEEVGDEGLGSGEFGICNRLSTVLALAKMRSCTGLEMTAYS